MPETGALFYVSGSMALISRMVSPAWYSSWFLRAFMLFSESPYQILPQEKD